MHLKSKVKPKSREQSQAGQGQNQSQSQPSPNPGVSGSLQTRRSFLQTLGSALVALPFVKLVQAPAPEPAPTEPAPHTPDSEWEWVECEGEIEFLQGGAGEWNDVYATGRVVEMDYAQLEKECSLYFCSPEFFRPLRCLTCTSREDCFNCNVSADEWVLPDHLANTPALERMGRVDWPDPDLADDENAYRPFAGLERLVTTGFSGGFPDCECDLRSGDCIDEDCTDDEVCTARGPWCSARLIGVNRPPDQDQGIKET